MAQHIVEDIRMSIIGTASDAPAGEDRRINAVPPGRVAAHRDAVQRLAEVPGLGADSAQQIIAAVGPAAATFPSGWLATNFSCFSHHCLIFQMPKGPNLTSFLEGRTEHGSRAPVMNST